MHSRAGDRPVRAGRVSPFGHPRIETCVAVPRGLSQPSTTFIASRYQVIHRAPVQTFEHSIPSNLKINPTSRDAVTTSTD